MHRVGMSCCAVVLALMETFASGAITFVDAVPKIEDEDSGNTFIYNRETSTAEFVNFTTDPTNATSTNSATDNKWWYRPDSGTQGAGGNIWAGGAGWETDTNASHNSGLSEDTNPLKVSIQLPAGTYRLYGFYFDAADVDDDGVDPVANPGNFFYDCSFSVDTTGSGPGTFAVFNQFNSDPADPSEFVSATGIVFKTAIGHTNPNVAPWTLMKASLGEVTLAAPTTVDIYVQGVYVDYSQSATKPTGWTETALNSNQRTEFEGIGYELVPEPKSMVMFIMGASALLYRWRRRNSAD